MVSRAAIHFGLASGSPTLTRQHMCALERVVEDCAMHGMYYTYGRGVLQCMQRAHTHSPLERIFLTYQENAVSEICLHA